MNLTDYTIFCDMDGVLVDFQGFVDQYTGREADWQHMTTENLIDDTTVRFVHALSIIYDVPVRSVPTLDTTPFWANLPWTDDGRKLWSALLESGAPITILTARPYAPFIANIIGIKSGKKAWCKKHLGKDINVIVVEADTKAKYACKSCILIDDQDDNIEQWEEAGGIVIQHTDTDSTLIDLYGLT